jgi:hypothetical protein
MLSNPGKFADLLEAAAFVIDRQEHHPGQPVPGVWVVGGSNTPERVITNVAASALARVCKTQHVNLEDALASYAEAARGIMIKPKGGPDVMAATHLRDAAYALRRKEIRLV